MDLPRKNGKRKKRRSRKVSKAFRTTLKRGNRIPMIVRHGDGGETVLAVGIDWDGKHYFDIPSNVHLIIPERRPAKDS